MYYLCGQVQYKVTHQVGHGLFSFLDNDLGQFLIQYSATGQAVKENILSLSADLP